MEGWSEVGQPGCAEREAIRKTPEGRAEAKQYFRVVQRASGDSVPRAVTPRDRRVVFLAASGAEMRPAIR